MNKYFIYHKKHGYLETPFKWNGNFLFARPYASLASAQQAAREHLIELPYEIQELDFDVYKRGGMLPKTIFTCEWKIVCGKEIEAEGKE